jgi:hypothetical protein
MLFFYSFYLLDLFLLYYRLLLQVATYLIILIIKIIIIILIIKIITPEDVLDFVILGNVFVQENNSINPMIDYHLIRGAMISFGIIPKATVMARTARIDVYIKT